jgi:hypothetical protein
MLVVACFLSSACNGQTVSLPKKVDNIDDIVGEYTPDVPFVPGKYPYVFQGMMQSGTVGASPVDVNLGITLPDSMRTLTVYKIVRPVVNDIYASKLASQLGFNGVPMGGYTGEIGRYIYIPK